ncbi:MAG: class I mannose-6-phosphate isomerase [Akkermansiaceae bacterium]|jgi:mannose-6-phosphate isomerase
MEPLTFLPIYMTRVWGGRSLESIYHRDLPDDQPYGESWEISDREDEQSVVKGGPYHGKTLHELWSSHREEIFGAGLHGDRFPLLIKILDARDDLSIQVHPPTSIAKQLGGEPKTEMWFIADCEPDAALYIGLKNGATRESFEQALREVTVEEVVHAVHPSPGESIFIPSGRLHAIGSGFLIYEIQQNSDTTYRVYDWNRVGLDGHPRDLHIDESLASIDFEDHEPTMDEPKGSTLASCEFFVVDRHELTDGQAIGNQEERFSILTVVSGTITSSGGAEFQKGDFLLLPKDADPLRATGDTVVLQTRLP